RGAHPPAGRCARGLLLPGAQPDRREARPDQHSGRRPRPDGHAEPGGGGRPAHVRLPDGSEQGPRPAARTGGGREGRRAPGDLGVRPDARQRLHLRQRLQDPPVRRRHRRGARLLRGAPRRRYGARRAARGADRFGCDRGARRQRGDRPGGSHPPVRDQGRPPAEPPAVAGDGVPGGGDAARVLMSSDEGHPRLSGALPPGQHWRDEPEIMHYGPVPRLRPDRWTFVVGGATADGLEHTFEWADLAALPRYDLVADMHCATRWSAAGMHWAGPRAVDVVALAPPAPEIARVLVFAEYGYAANVPLADLRTPST